MSLKIFFSVIILVIGNYSLAQPNLSCEWGSTYGKINWSEGWYGNKTKTISGSLTKEGNQHIYRGTWGRTNSAKSGNVVFTFTNNSSFIGYWTIKGESKQYKWTGSGSCTNETSNCLEYRTKIAKLQETIIRETKEYNKLVKDIEDFDQNTRLNFCTKTVDHYTDIGVLEFDASWNSYLSKLNKKLGHLGKIPALSGAVKGLSKTISYLILGLNEWESQQLPVEQAIEEYYKIKKMRKQVIDELVYVLKKYYCNHILQYDSQLYELYNTEIPNNTSCNAFEINQLKQEITRNRPSGLPSAIWTENNYRKQLNECN